MKLPTVWFVDAHLCTHLLNKIVKTASSSSSVIYLMLTQQKRKQCKLGILLLHI